MDREIVTLFQEEASEKLSKRLDELSNKELGEIIKSRLLRGKSDAVNLLRALFYGSPAGKSEGAARRQQIFKCCIELLQGHDLNSKVAQELVGLLLLETDSLSASHLAELANLFVDSIKNGIVTTGKCLELFPKLLSSLAVQEGVHDDEGREMSGAEYKSHLLNRLCSARWAATSIIHLAAMFKDIPMSTDELKFVIEKMMRLFSEVEIQELPPLVYQLLLLTAKGHKRMVLEGVISHFVSQDELYRKHKEPKDLIDDLSETVGGVDELRHVEGTIILHITFSMKQDHQLAREFIKYIKASQSSHLDLILAPFTLALALSISGIQRFKEQMFDLLKSSILKSFRDTDRRNHSGWIREMVSAERDVTQPLLDTVKNSKYGWDHVTQGLVELGFLLMDTCGPRATFGKVTEVTIRGPKTPMQRTCDLGAAVLLETFKAHQVVRSDLLEQILNRVVTKASAPVSHFLALLSQVVSSAPQVLLDSLSKVRDAFDYLAYLPPPTSSSLLRAIQPLLKISMPLKDSLILVLRKAMFSKQLEARKMAVSGFLMILRNFRVLGNLMSSQPSSCPSFSSSQVFIVDVHQPYNAASNEALCLEILGSLRRTLSQQADVRLQLYQGLYEVLSKNIRLQGPILQLLQQQLMRYYEKGEDVQPPLRLQPCIQSQGDQTYLSEPLAHLLSCLVQCQMKAEQSNHSTEDEEDDDDDDDFNRGQIKEMLNSLTKRIIKSDLEDFELDRSADFSTTSGVGVRNNIFAILVMSTYEVLMEYSFTTGNYETLSCERVLQLHQNFQKLSGILREKAGGAKKGGAGNPKSLPKSLLSIQFVENMLRALLTDDVSRDHEAVAVLRETVDLQRYIAGVALQKLQQIVDTGSCEGFGGNNDEELFEHCSSIAGILFQQYTADLEGRTNQSERNKQLTSICLEALATAVHAVITHFKGKLQTFITKLDSSDGNEDLDNEDLIHKFIKRLQRMVVTILEGGDDDRNQKESLSLLAIINELSNELEAGGQQYAQVQTWAVRICKETAIDDPAVTKTMLTLLMTLSQRQKHCFALGRDLAQDVHAQCGDIDQDVEIEKQSNYACVTERTASPTVMLLVLSMLDQAMDDMDWLVTRLQAELAANTPSLNDSMISQQEGQEKTVCISMGSMINMCHELVQSAIPVGAITDHLLKSLAHLYTSLTNLTKMQISMFQKHGRLSTKFEKLVQLSGRNLTTYVYAFITYIQASQNENLQQAAEKSKKKDKKISAAAAQAGKAKVLKESRFIPNLIFAIEQFEKFLIQLSKKSKVNLMQHIKLSTSRDFRINVQSLTAALQEQDSSESEDGGDEPGEDNNAAEAEIGDGSDEESSKEEESSDESDDQENAHPNKNKRPSSTAAEKSPPAKKGKLAKMAAMAKKSR